ncbi:MAG: DUF5683 domain-containing protein [Bacteroidota bacterium]
MCRSYRYAQTEIHSKNAISKWYGIICILFFFLIFHSTTYSQTDSTKVKNDTIVNVHSPTKATLMSTFLPGLGQFYNKKYWKLPIVYAGLGLTVYFAITNYQQYYIYRNAYRLRTDGDSNTIDTRFTRYSTASILSAKNYYERNYELSCIIGVLIYLLNIIDASVDANLFDFNINEDVSMRVSPESNYSLLNPRSSFTGIKLSLKF